MPSDSGPTVPLEYKTDGYSHLVDLGRGLAGKLTEEILCFFKETLVHRTIVFSTRSRKLLEFAPLFGVQLRRHFHDNSDAQVSANFGVHVLHPVAAKAQFRPALRSGRDFQQRVPLEGRNLHLTSQSRS